MARWPVARCKIEDMNYDPDTGEQRQIYALSIASKRYAPFGYDKDGRPRLLGEPGCYKRSEHGLGHLLDPTSHDVDKPQDRFYDRWWDQILHDELGIPLDQPDWFDRPAVGGSPSPAGTKRARSAPTTPISPTTSRPDRSTSAS